MAQKINVESGNPYRDAEGHFGTSPDEKLKESFAKLQAKKLVTHKDNQAKVAAVKKQAKEALDSWRKKETADPTQFLNTRENVDEHRIKVEAIDPANASKEDKAYLDKVIAETQGALDIDKFPYKRRDLTKLLKEASLKRGALGDDTDAADDKDTTGEIKTAQDVSSKIFGIKEDYIYHGSQTDISNFKDGIKPSQSNLFGKAVYFAKYEGGGGVGEAKTQFRVSSSALIEKHGAAVTESDEMTGEWTTPKQGNIPDSLYKSDGLTSDGDMDNELQIPHQITPDLIEYYDKESDSWKPLEAAKPPKSEDTGDGKSSDGDKGYNPYRDNAEKFSEALSIAEDKGLVKDADDRTKIAVAVLVERAKEYEKHQDFLDSFNEPFIAVHNDPSIATIPIDGLKDMQAITNPKYVIDEEEVNAAREKIRAGEVLDPIVANNVGYVMGGMPTVEALRLENETEVTAIVDSDGVKLSDIFDSNSAAGSIQEQRDARAAAGITREGLIDDFENKHRNDKIETFYAVDKYGEVIEEKQGEERSVSMLGSTSVKIGRAEDVVLTHNHPADISFSAGDIGVGIGANAVQMRAASSSFNHIMTRPEGGWPDTMAVLDYFEGAKKRAVADAQRRFNRREVSREHAENYQAHFAMVDTAEHFGFKYERVEIKQ